MLEYLCDFCNNLFFKYFWRTWLACFLRIFLIYCFFSFIRFLNIWLMHIFIAISCPINWVRSENVLFNQGEEKNYSLFILVIKAFFIIRVWVEFSQKYFHSIWLLDQLNLLNPFCRVMLWRLAVMMRRRFLESKCDALASEICFEFLRDVYQRRFARRVLNDLETSAVRILS